MAHPLYSTSAWKRLRACQLQREPFCRMCDELGRMTPATVVDHSIPHRGDARLFWRSDLWVALCQPCHDRHKQRLETSGVLAGCDERGIPLDPSHPWARQAGPREASADGGIGGQILPARRRTPAPGSRVCESVHAFAIRRRLP